MAPQKLDSNGNPAVGVWNGVEVVPYQPFDQALVDNAAQSDNPAANVTALAAIMGWFEADVPA